MTCPERPSGETQALLYLRTAGLLLISVVCTAIVARSYSPTIHHVTTPRGASRASSSLRATLSQVRNESRLHNKESRMQARPRLVYKHFPKTGGTYVRAHLGKLIPDDMLVVIEEFDSLSSLTTDAADSFVIGSIRAPCEYYLSLWSYGSHGKGWQFAASDSATQQELYGRSPPFDNKQDRERLTAWLLENAALLTGRVRQSYGLERHELAAVDCWLHTEQLHDDLRDCLLEYEARQGTVNWRSFPGEGVERLNSATHAPCEVMFDSSLQALVREMDGRVFSAFNYSSCC